MHALILLLPAVLGAQHQSWDAYMNANRYRCPGPLDTLAAPRTLTLGNKKYIHNGFELSVSEGQDADARVSIGVMSAIKDTSDGTQRNVEEAMEWFRQNSVEWVVVNGDLALEELDLEEVLDMLGKSGLPTLVIVGNSESRSSFARAYKDRATKYPQLINGNWIRQIKADDVELWTMPGYYDKQFVHQGSGCKYSSEDLDTLATLQPAGDRPVALVSHGPPLGQGPKALDWIFDKKNVGDEALTGFINKKQIPFGLFGHILEAGGTAVSSDFKTAVSPTTPSPKLYVNAGSISADPWAMNDGSTATGMALLVEIDAGKAQYRIKRFKAPASP